MRISKRGGDTLDETIKYSKTLKYVCVCIRLCSDFTILLFEALNNISFDNYGFDKNFHLFIDNNITDGDSFQQEKVCSSKNLVFDYCIFHKICSRIKMTKEKLFISLITTMIVVTSADSSMKLRNGPSPEITQLLDKTNVQLTISTNLGDMYWVES